MKKDARKELLFSIDLGTQSVRSMIFDLEGNLLYITKLSIESYFSPQPGWAEQRVDYFWDKVCESCKATVKQAGKEIMQRIAGVSVTTQRNTVVNLDKNGQPLRNAIVWPDERKGKILQRPKLSDRILHKLAGMSEAVKITQQDCEINWLKAYQPDIWEKTHKYLYLSGYILYKLTGKYVDSVASQVGYIPFDYKRFTWSKKNNFKWKIFPVEKEKLPLLYKPGEIIGTITRQASIETGLQENLNIISSGSDKSCETLGIGALTPNIASLSLGTTATVETTITKYTEVIPFMPPYPAAIPDSWTTEIQIFRGFWLISWFKQEFDEEEVEEAVKKHLVPDEFINHLLKDSSPGALGLILQPYWTPGLKDPGPEAKGAIIGFADAHKKAHFYRAIVEGLGYALLEGMQRTEKRIGNEIKSVRVAGGGSNSDDICQILADIFGKPVVRTKVTEASGLGAAINCGIGSKLFPDYQSAVEKMVHIAKTFSPNMKNHKLYNRLYNEIYRKLYKKLKPLYKKIREITNYPSF